MMFNTMETDEIFRGNADKSKRPRTETLRKSPHLDNREPKKETENITFSSSSSPQISSLIRYRNLLYYKTGTVANASNPSIWEAEDSSRPDSAT